MGDMADWQLDNMIIPDDEARDMVECPMCGGCGYVVDMCLMCMGSGIVALEE